MAQIATNNLFAQQNPIFTKTLSRYEKITQVDTKYIRIYWKTCQHKRRWTKTEDSEPYSCNRRTQSPLRSNFWYCNSAVPAKPVPNIWYHTKLK